MVSRIGPRADPQDADWVVKGGGGQTFEEVDLSDPDGWAEVEEKSGEPVGIYEFESKFALHKGK